MSEKFNVPELAPEESDFRFRKHVNPERGTEIDFVTVPIETIDGENFREKMFEFIGKIYDANNINNEPVPYYGGMIPHEKYLFNSSGYLGYANEFILQLKAFVKSDEQEIHLAVRGLPSLSIKKTKKNLLITPTPYLHTITLGADSKKRMENSSDVKITAFSDLTRILNTGFHSRLESHVDNVIKKSDKKHTINYFYKNFSSPFERVENEVTRGDSYTIEMFVDEFNSGNGHLNNKSNVTRLEKVGPVYSSGHYHALHTGTNRILSINILIQQDLQEEVIKQKMRFYQEEITKKYNVPVRFFIDYTEKGKAEKLKRIFPTD